jgi:hypothetical protein
MYWQRPCLKIALVSALLLAGTPSGYAQGSVLARIIYRVVLDGITILVTPSLAEAERTKAANPDARITKEILRQKFIEDYKHGYVHGGGVPIGPMDDNGDDK